VHKTRQNRKEDLFFKNQIQLSCFFFLFLSLSLSLTKKLKKERKKIREDKEEAFSDATKSKIKEKKLDSL